jgi:hypothetical protein
MTLIETNKTLYAFKNKITNHCIETDIEGKRGYIGLTISSKNIYIFFPKQEKGLNIKSLVKKIIKNTVC